MTSLDVIDQINRLPRGERLKVLEFARHADPQMLSPDELGEIARRMTETTDEEEAKQLRQEFLRGFYGSQTPDA